MSPEALKSTWVLLEIGGARALRKRLVPIMLHISANDIPSPLSKDLARDLNEIERYYDEAVARAQAADLPSVESSPGEPSVESVDVPPRRPREYQIGDVVKLPEQPQADVTKSWGAVIGWNKSMTAHCGKTAIVKALWKDGGVRLDVDQEQWVWAYEWLEPAPSVSQ